MGHRTAAVRQIPSGRRRHPERMVTRSHRTARPDDATRSLSGARRTPWSSRRRVSVIRAPTVGCRSRDPTRYHSGEGEAEAIWMCPQEPGLRLATRRK
jgi:hypothetical protein